jgi:RNA polymerase sigma-70 factor (ECF subfamily)
MGTLQSVSGEFRTTSWTLILNAQHNAKDLEALLLRYHEPIRAYFARKARTAHDAEDLAQEFIRKMVLEGELLQKADPERGRFRHFLKCALNRFAIDEHRRVYGRNSSRATTFRSSENGYHDDAATPDGDDPTLAFEQEYRRKLLSDVREALEQCCKADGLHQHWHAYEARVLNPLLHGVQPTSVEALAKTFKLPAPKVSHMIETVRRRSVQIARELVAQTIDNPDDLDDEIRSLWAN